MDRYVYRFGPHAAEGGAEHRELLGAKGANLAEMAAMGLPVPAGLTISTEACAHYLHHGQLPPGLSREVEEGIAAIEEATGRGFGDAHSPLLLSARSGGPEPMPGMMETVLNLGLNDTTAAGLVDESGDDRFVADCRRRLVEMYATVVLQIDSQALRHCIDDACQRVGTRDPGQLTAHHWQQVIEDMHEIIGAQTDRGVPPDPYEQLWRSVEAIFRSWNSPRTRSYRRLHGIETGPGTAVTIMAMVFGNRDERSVSGIGFSRNPVTGWRRPYGEYLGCTQGVDVVGGRRTPGPLHKADLVQDDVEALQESMPEIYDQLCDMLLRLEKAYGDAQKVEFTVESGTLWLLQTGRATRTGPAAVRMALEMVDDELIDDEEALMRVDPRRHVPRLFHKRIDTVEEHTAPAFEGIAASPGAATGRLVTTTAEALARSRRGEAVILVRPTTTVDDVDGLDAAAAVITTDGGLTAHAAGVAREVGLPCVCGVGAITVADDESGVHVGDQFIPRGQVLTVDGSSGKVYVGALALIDGLEGDARWNQFLQIADRYQRMGVRVDADSIDEVERGLDAGGDGIGMCRTEQMILAGPERVMAMRRVLLSGDEEQADRAMDELLEVHRHDIAQILRAADGKPVALRLLDAPLSAFLPRDDGQLRATAEALDVEIGAIETRTEALQEADPMLGLRGSRLAVVQPSMYAMQVQAIVEASRMVVDDGIAPTVEILIPRISTSSELRQIADDVEATIAEYLHGATKMLTIDIGVVVQVPGAALISDELAPHVDCLTLATRELTRWTWGMSGEDAGRFMEPYIDSGLVSHDPFRSLDRRAVGELMRTAIGRSRVEDPELVVGVDRGHGADPRSIRFFESLDVDYLTVRPDDVLATRLAAAQAYVAYERALDRQRAGAGGR